jgi:hypothetical protein
VKIVSAPQPALPAPLRPSQPAAIAPEPARERLLRRESVREEESMPDDAEDVVTNVVLLEPLRDQHEHRPTADSKCPWCRKLWVQQ